MIIKLSKREDADKILQVKKIWNRLTWSRWAEVVQFLLTIVCVATVKTSGSNVKSCSIMNIYMDSGFRKVQ